MIKSFEDATFWDLVRETWAMPVRHGRIFWRMQGYTVVCFLAVLVLTVAINFSFDHNDTILWPIWMGILPLGIWIFVKWIRAFAEEYVDTKIPKLNIPKSISWVVFLTVCASVVFLTIHVPLALVGHSILGGDSLANYLIGIAEMPFTLGYVVYYLAAIWLAQFAYVLFLTAIVRAALGISVKFVWPNFLTASKFASYLFVVFLPYYLIGILAVEFDSIPLGIIRVILAFLLMPVSAFASLIVYQRLGFSLPENPEPVPNQ